MKRSLLALVLFVIAAGCRQHAADEHAATPAPAPSVAANPVQNEMRLLSAALQSTVQAIGMGDVRGVSHALHGVHAAREATDAALSSGAYRLPKHPEALERFRTLDEAFHHKLEQLEQASQPNDLRASADAFAALLPSCIECHAEFRP